MTKVTVMNKIELSPRLFLLLLCSCRVDRQTSMSFPCISSYFSCSSFVLTSTPFLRVQFPLHHLQPSSCALSNNISFGRRVVQPESVAFSNVLGRQSPWKDRSSPTECCFTALVRLMKRDFSNSAKRIIAMEKEKVQVAEGSWLKRTPCR